MKEKTTKDIQTRQQMWLSELRQRKRRRGREKQGSVDRKGEKTVEKAIDFICWAVLIVFVLLFIVGTLLFTGTIMYFYHEFKEHGDTEIYTEQQREEDEIQMLALKADAERRAEKKRRKKKWMKRDL